MSELEEYRVLLAQPPTRQIFLAEECGKLRVPRVAIPKWARPAETLTEAVDKKWHVDAIVVDFLPGDSIQPDCAVLEIRQKDWRASNGDLIPVGADSAGVCGLSHRAEAALREILQGKCGSRGPFSRLGWVDDAQEWIKSAITDRDVCFTNQTRQLNACGTFALVRFATKCGRAYWLKAVGEPNAHEFAVTTYLAEHCPTYLPKLVCARGDWNAWVMQEGGQSLERPLPLPRVEEVVTQMATVQTAFVGNTNDLLRCGCVDQRIEVLEAHVDQVITYLAEAMGLQTSTKVPRLSEARLRELAAILQAACSAMRALNIPDSLLHNDLNAGNVLFDESRCLFIDWAEAYVGNPFLIFPQLCSLISCSEDTSLTWVQRLKTLYKGRWSSLLTDSQVDRAFVLTPILAVLSHLYGRGSWLRSPLDEDSHIQGFRRSLARYMDRAAQSPDLLEVL
jgi:hypothetical protein